MGFSNSGAGHCVYVRSQKGTKVFIGIFVDDLIMLSDSKVELTEIKATLSTALKMKDLGEIKYYLCITVVRDEDKLSIHQKYWHYVFLGRSARQY